MFSDTKAVVRSKYDDGVIGFATFFKQKTAYEMRESDWSSDVCSSDLAALAEVGLFVGHHTHVLKE